MAKSYKTVEITNQCKYGFTMDYIKSRLDGWSVVKDYAYILHDKDIKEDGTLKESHPHLLLRFNSAVPTSNILARFDKVVTIDGKQYKSVNENNLQKCHKWTSAIAYLTHANRLDKYQYSDTEVISNYDWQLDREKALNPIKDERLNNIISSIENESMRKYNYMDFVTAQEYVRYKRQIEDAFKYVNDRNISKGTVKNMKVMYLSGESGTGKTTYAKQFCDEHKLSYYVSSGSNDVLDGYGGQDVLILDDLRPSTLGLSDLLKLLDNNTSSTIKSRYMNKSIAYCKYIIITTVLDINNFFKNVFKEEEEPILQLKRRCETYMRFHKQTIDISVYEDTLKDYRKIATIPNAVAIEFEKKQMTEEKAVALLNDLFVGMSDMAQYVVSKEKSLQDEFTDITDDIENPFI